MISPSCCPPRPHEPQRPDPPSRSRPPNSYTTSRDTTRSPSLLRALSRNWERLYADCQTVPSEHEARVYFYKKGPVTAAWLNELRETPWVAVARGELVVPNAAVVRTLETQTLYGTFVCEIGREDIKEGLARALHLITDVRVGDLLTRLEELRDSAQPVEGGMCCRSIARSPSAARVLSPSPRASEK